VAGGDLLVVFRAARFEHGGDLVLRRGVALVLLRNGSPRRSLLGRRRRVAAAALLLRDDVLGRSGEREAAECKGGGAGGNRRNEFHARLLWGMLRTLICAALLRTCSACSAGGFCAWGLWLS